MSKRFGTFALLLQHALADYDTFPVKSINLTGADTIAWYKLEGMGDYGLDDPHPVHGIQLSDGGFLLGGTASRFGQP